MKKFLILPILCLLFAACAKPDAEPLDAAAAETPPPTAVPTEAPMPSPTPEAVEIPTPEPTPSPTPSPSPTPTPTPTPSPTPTPTPTPSPTPVPEKIGIISSRFLDRFSAEPVDTDDEYRDATRSITITRYETKERTGRTLVYFVADIYVQNVKDVRRAFNGKSYQNQKAKSVRRFSKDLDALLLLSGDHCTASDKAYVVVNGETVHQSKKLTRDLCVLYRDGELKTYAPDEVPYEEMEARGVWQTWNFGPMLLDESGKPMKKFNTPYSIGERNPRAVLGFYEPGHYCFVLVDGRQKSYSMGLSLSETALLMQYLGCTAAYNLDGGLSAQMTWHKKRINHPKADRSIIDVVYIPYTEAAHAEEGANP